MYANFAMGWLFTLKYIQVHFTSMYGKVCHFVILFVFDWQLWAPPTPPQDDNDVYMDQTMCFLYEPSVMPETQLPPVYVKKEFKRIRHDTMATSKLVYNIWLVTKYGRNNYNRDSNSYRERPLRKKYCLISHHKSLCYDQLFHLK